MRQPNFGGPRGPHAQNQGGIQKIDKNTRNIIWRMAKLVLGDYKLSIGVVLVCIVVTSITTLASTLFTHTLIDDYIVPRQTEIRNSGRGQLGIRYHDHVAITSRHDCREAPSYVSHAAFLCGREADIVTEPQLL